MKLLVALSMAIAASIRLVHAASFDEDKPHGRVCVAVADSAAGAKEEPLRSSSAPGAGKRINVYLDSSTKCTALLVALRKDGRLAYGWRPQVVDLPGDAEEVELPKAPATWDWTSAGEAFDFYVVFLSSGGKDAEDLKKLAAVMQDSKTDERLLAMQTNKFRELLGRVAADKDRASQVVADPEVGGLFRGAAFPWRQFASGVNFDSTKAGVLIIPSARTAGETASPAKP